MNRATIMGRLGADPEVRSFNNGGRICTFTVATSDRWTDKQSGEKRERTEWHRIALYADPLVTLAEINLRKGARVLIEGQLETRKWQGQDGQDRYTTEVALRPFRGDLTIIDWPEGERDKPQQSGGNDFQRPLDDEIPF